MAENQKSSELKAKLSEMSVSGRVDYPFHMIRDKKTEMYVKFAKVMVICQGPYTDSREKNYEKVHAVFKSSSRTLSDATFRLEFRSACTPDSTSEFYNYLKAEVKSALELGYNLVYIDTTMSNKSQNEYYFAMANKMQYSILTMPPVVTRRPGVFQWPKGSQARSFQDLKTRIEAPNMFDHLFCGWFLHDIDSDELRNECALYVNDLFESKETEFTKWFSKIGSAKDFPKYFKLVQEDVKKEDMVMREDLAFCPVKVFISKYLIPEYFEKQAVQDNYGKIAKLHIVGFVISPYVVAARVKLTQKQKELWEMDDNVKESGFVATFPSVLYRESCENLPVAEIRRICSKSNNTIVRGEHFHEPSKAIHAHAKGRTCHIVLGTSKEAPPEEVDYGVAFALNRELKLEQQARDNKDALEAELIDIGKSQVKRIGKYWMIYLKDTLVINGFFTSCCRPCDFESPVQDAK